MSKRFFNLFLFLKKDYLFKYINILILYFGRKKRKKYSYKEKSLFFVNIMIIVNIKFINNSYLSFIKIFYYYFYIFIIS